MAPAYVFRPMTSADLPLIRRWLADAACGAMVGRSGRTIRTGQRRSRSSEPWTSSSWRRMIARSATSNATIRTTGTTRIGRPAHGHARHRPVHRRAGHDGPRPRLGIHPAFTERLLAIGAPRVVTDPDPANARAIRAYEKAGFVQRPHGRYAGWPRPADGAQPMTLERNVPAVSRSFDAAMDADRGRPARAAGLAPVCDGPAADLRLRLCEALAWRGAELGEFAAHRRLVHVLAHPARFPVLRRDLAAAADAPWPAA